MASDRSLAALLRAIQSPSVSHDESRILGSATSLLTLLSNPLNVTLLASQLLTAPALWQGPPVLRTALQLIGVFSNASAYLVQRDQSQNDGVASHEPEGLLTDEWIKAVVKGADDKSPRWRHLIVLGGVLLGLERREWSTGSPELRQNLHAAVVTASNLALEEAQRDGEEALHVICLVLAHTFDLLNEREKTRLDHSRLLPILTHAIYFSKDGLHWGYFVGTMDSDLLQSARNKFFWSPKSASYLQAKRMAASPLIGALGSLSRLVAYCVNATQHVELMFNTAVAIQKFSRSVAVQWQQNKLSEVDPSEESVFLDDETVLNTMPTLWQLLKQSLFSTVIIQSGLVGRLLSDSRISANELPGVAIKTLHTLRNLYFITDRLGQQLFSQHTFVYTASIDILSRYSKQIETFLDEIRPTEFGRIPEHPYQRLLDLFFLNTAEHFTLALPLATNRDLLLGAAAPYSGIGQDPRLVEIFEAAHSVTLSVFSAPQNYLLTIEALPGYVETLFQVFPLSLSVRQFRLAIKTLIYITCAPGPISAAQPLLGPTIMELVFSRALAAPGTPLPPLPRQDTPNQNAELHISEQSALVLTLIDSLASLSLSALEEWLTLTAEAMNAINDEPLKDVCRKRFWEVLNNGEMDVARAQLCVTWWTTHAGREMVLYGQAASGNTGIGMRQSSKAEPMMSGALPEPRQDKL